MKLSKHRLINHQLDIKLNYLGLPLRRKLHLWLPCNVWSCFNWKPWSRALFIMKISRQLGLKTTFVSLDNWFDWFGIFSPKCVSRFSWFKGGVCRQFTFLLLNVDKTVIQTGQKCTDVRLWDREMMYFSHLRMLPLARGEARRPLSVPSCCFCNASCSCCGWHYSPLFSCMEALLYLLFRPPSAINYPNGSLKLPPSMLIYFLTGDLSAVTLWLLAHYYTALAISIPFQALLYYPIRLFQS